MFALKSRYLRRRLSAPTSGSARRRARERRLAQHTRAEGERLAREKRDQRMREKFEHERQAREQLASYCPWGGAGGGAPNSHALRRTDLRAFGIYPEDELKAMGYINIRQQGVSPHEVLRRRMPRRRSQRRLVEDPQLCYADGLRNAVDNDIRYRQTADEQKCYKEILDDMVKAKKKALKNEIKQDKERDEKNQAMDGPWGKPGPGGTTWRNPRDVGLNFSNSMGWTDNEMLNKIKRDYTRQKRSSLTLPAVKKVDDVREKENTKPSSVEKLPDINNKSSSDEEAPQVKFKDTDKKTESKEKVKIKNSVRKTEKFVKRLTNGEKLSRILPVIDSSSQEGQTTPEGGILRLTGGIELVPLLARRRKVGPRTLPSSDVTRPPEFHCEWRELLNADYLQDLKQQIQTKCLQQEESRRDSAESCLRHHATWASLWGRPGHGAPLRGRYARTNLAHLLYVAPLAM